MRIGSFFPRVFERVSLAGLEIKPGKIAELMSVVAAIAESSEIAGADYGTKVEVDLADTAIVIAPRPV